LPNLQARLPGPVDSDKAELREAQSRVLSEPATGMAVTIDCGEVDFHPKDKRQVAQRLADVALAVAYDRPIHYRGPRYQSHIVQGNVITVKFAVDAGPLRSRAGEPITGFAVAGEDRRFEWATAIIDGESVRVCSPRVARPVTVRYAWANNPDCNVYDAHGLPAEPFRTDRWPGLTDVKSVGDGPPLPSAEQPAGARGEGE
jgi:sialate O-acetylesterase